jgi:hypothetical protein
MVWMIDMPFCQLVDHDGNMTCSPWTLMMLV